MIPHDAAARESAAKRGNGVFAQILGKLYFLELLENLRSILLDYAQKRTG